MAVVKDSAPLRAGEFRLCGGAKFFAGLFQVSVETRVGVEAVAVVAVLVCVVD